MGPFDIFQPSAILDPSRFTGDKLVEAARQFPGGPTALVFALFWSPVGPGIPAGVLLARHVPLNPIVTFGLYALSDVLAAVVCHPIFLWLRRHGRRIRPIRWLGRRIMSVAMLGVRAPEPMQPAEGRRLAPTLARIATLGFGVDVYTAGMVATGLPIPRVAGWASAIAGDLIWFAVLLATSIAAASVADDDRVIGLVVIAAMILLPQLAQRFVPALRQPPR